MAGNSPYLHMDGRKWEFIPQEPRAGTKLGHYKYIGHRCANSVEVFPPREGDRSWAVFVDDINILELPIKWAEHVFTIGEAFARQKEALRDVLAQQRIMKAPKARRPR